MRYLLTGEGDGLPLKAFGHLPQRYRKVVLLLIDSFGWRFLMQHYKDYPALKRFADVGVISKISVQFPSTTSAHVTTINSGLPVGESGVYEWFYYEPSLDAIISPLTFSYAATPARDLAQRRRAQSHLATADPLSGVGGSGRAELRRSG